MAVRARTRRRSGRAHYTRGAGRGRAAIPGISRPSPEIPRRGRIPYHRPSPRAPSRASERREDLRRQLHHPRAQLARRRCQRPNAWPARDADRRRSARQAQARVHPARRHRWLRHRRQRGEDLGERQQAHREALLPPLRLPGRDQVPHAGGDAGAAPRRGHPARGQGHAAPQPPRPQAADEAEGLRRPGASARRAAASAPGDQLLGMSDQTPQDPKDEQETPTPETGAEAQADEITTPAPAAEEPAAADAPQAQAPEGEAPAADAPAAEAPAADAPAAEADAEQVDEEVDETPATP